MFMRIKLTEMNMFYPNFFCPKLSFTESILLKRPSALFPLENLPLIFVLIEKIIGKKGKFFIKDFSGSERVHFS